MAKERRWKWELALVITAWLICSCLVVIYTTKNSALSEHAVSQRRQLGLVGNRQDYIVIENEEVFIPIVTTAIDVRDDDDVVDRHSMAALLWIKITGDGSHLRVKAPAGTRSGKHAVCLARKKTLYYCFTVEVETSNTRHRRASTPDGTFTCVSTLPVSMTTLILSTNYALMTQETRDGIADVIANYAGVPASNVSVTRGQGIGFFTQLHNATVITSGPGNSNGIVISSTLVNWFVSCGALNTDSEVITKIRTDAGSGTLSNSIAHPIMGWYVTVGYVSHDESVHLGVNGTSSLDLSIRYHLAGIVILSKFTVNYTIPKEAFHDRIDGYADNMDLELRNSSNVKVERTSWIYLSDLRLLGFVTRAVATNQPAGDYMFYVVATNSRGATILQELEIKISATPPSPNYVVNFQYTSSDVVVYFTMPDVRMVELMMESLERQVGLSRHQFLVVTMSTTRVNGLLTLDLKLTTLSLAGSGCNVNDAILLQRQLSPPRLAASLPLLPATFTMISTSIEASGACSFLSQSVPSKGVFPSTIQVNIGKIFQETIPETAFSSSPGSASSRIRLELRQDNGAPLSDAYHWLALSASYIDERAAINGVSTSGVSALQTTFPFTLYGFSSLGAFAYHELSINMVNGAAAGPGFVVAITQPGKLRLSSYNFASSFISVTSQYLGVDTSVVLLETLTTSDTVSTIAFTLDGIANTNPCNVAQLSDISDKLVQVDGTIHPQYASLLSASVQMTFPRIQLTLSGSCHKPLIRRPVGSLEVISGTILQYVILPSYYSYTGGSEKLSYEILNNAAANKRWIDINDTSIYVIPYKDEITVGVRNPFTLRVTSTSGESVDDSFFVTAVASALNSSYVIKGALSAMDTTLSRPVVTALFLHKLQSYMGQLSGSSLRVHAFTLFRGRFRVTWSNVSLQYYPCDVSSMIDIKRRLTVSLGESTPSQEVEQFFKPEFQTTSFQEEGVGPCADRRNTNPAIAPMNLLPLTVSTCEPVIYQFPRTFAVDEEEGDIRNLNVAVTYDNQPLTSTFPVSFDANTQTFTFILNDEAYSLANGRLRLRTVISDSLGGKVAAGAPTFKLTKPMPGPFYNVTLNLRLSNHAEKTYADQQKLIFDQLRQAIGGEFYKSIYMRKYDITSHAGQQGDATLVISPCGMPQDACDEQLIQEFQSKLFTASSTVPSSELTGVLGGSLEIRSMEQAFSGPCSRSPPVTNIPVVNLEITFCGYLIYTIPDNMFYDAEDGYTRNLTLQWTTPEGVIPTYPWIWFVASTQTLYGILSDVESTISSNTIFRFQLTATDKSSLAAIASINVKIVGSFAESGFEITLSATPLTVTPYRHALITLGQTVASYIGSTGKLFLVTSAQEDISSGKYTFRFSNCSIGKNPCNVYALDFMERTLGTGTNWQQGFLRDLSRVFSDVVLSSSYSGACAINNPPVVDVPIGQLNLDPRSTFRYRVMNNSFSDVEQGGADSLRLQGTVSVDNTQGLFARYESSSRSIVAIATVTGISQAVMVLRAFDIKNLMAQQDVVLLRSSRPLVASHIVIMNIRFSVTYFGNEVTVFSNMRSLLLTYLGYSQSSLAVEYVGVVSRTSASAQIQWRNSLLSSEQCDTSALDDLKRRMTADDGGVNTQLSSALSTIGTVNSIDVIYDGVCKNAVTTPQVLNPPPLLRMAACAYLRYQIPSNTFTDIIDGDTRGLSLSLTDIQGGSLPATYWAHFDTVTQTVIAVLNDKIVTDGQVPSLVSFILTATSARGLSNRTFLNISTASYVTARYSFAFMMTFTWEADTVYTRPVVYSTLLDRMQVYLFGANTTNTFRILEVVTDQPSFFALDLTSCRLTYDPCDMVSINAMSSATTNAQGLTPEVIAYLTPEINLIIVSERMIGPCVRPNSRPTALTSIGPIYTYVCTSFTYTIPARAFQDEEDGRDLTLTITRLNGVSVSAVSWMSMQSSVRQVVGVVTYNTVFHQPTGGYDATIRATDSGGLWAESSTKIIMVGNTPQIFYSIILQMTGTQPYTSRLDTMRFFVTTINTYYSSNITNTLALNVSGSSLRFHWSPANLPNSCHEGQAAAFFESIKRGTQLVPAFTNIFGSKFNLIDATLISDSQCSGPQNRPIPRSPTWDIAAVSYCGGLSIIVPADMFNDPEDGMTRNLDLSLTQSDGSALPVSYWLRFNKATQALVAAPTREEAVENNQQRTSFTLTAADSSGLSASVTIRFTFTVFELPAYRYVINYETTNQDQHRVDEIRAFATALTLFLRQSDSTSFGLLKFQVEANNRRTVTFGNCSVSYDPCEVRKLNEVKSAMLLETNLPRETMRSALLPRFDVKYGYVQFDDGCSGVVSTPPMVSRAMSSITVQLCRTLVYQIPRNTFYDAEQGDSRTLNLTLELPGGNPLGIASWLRLDHVTQTIYAQPTVAAMETQATNGQTIVLSATDNTQLTARTSFPVKIEGSGQIPRDCGISMTVTSSSSFDSTSSVELMQSVVEKIAQYLQLSSADLTVVDFQRISSTRYNIIWSICASSFEKVEQSVVTFDYQRFITSVLRNIFPSKGFNANSQFLEILGSSFAISSVETRFSGTCANMRPVPKKDVSPYDLQLSMCGSQSLMIDDDYFYDFEDGNARSLRLTLMDANNKQVPSSSWINYDQLIKMITATPLDEQRVAPVQTSYEYYLQATDSGGLVASIKIDVKVTDPERVLPSLFYFTLEMLYHGSSDVPMASLTGGLVSNISSYFSLSINDVRIKSFQHLHTSPKTAVVTWSTCNSQTCSSLVYQKIQQTRGFNGEISSAFTQAFLPWFRLERWIFHSSICDIPTNRPTNPTTIPPIDATFCEEMTYTLPSSLFVEIGRGDIRTLSLSLQDEQGNAVSSSSWLQLNSASLSLFGIRIASEDPNKTYQLQATGSSGLSTSTSFRTVASETPYVPDCEMTLRVRRRFGDDQTADLYILSRLMELINNFYGSEQSGIKVIRFTKESTTSYKITWSSCSLRFQSKQQSMSGLDSSDRARVTAIFSRIVTDNGDVQQSFRTFLNESFEAISSTVSYSCIETSPKPQVTQLTAYAPSCRGLNYLIPQEAFQDEQDGDTRSLSLSITYPDGRSLYPGEWVLMDAAKQTLYGIVTNQTLQTSPSQGYRYLLIATDKSGRSSNLSLVVVILASTSQFSVQFILGFDQPNSVGTSSATSFLWNVTNRLISYGSDVINNGVFISGFSRSGFVSFYYCDLPCNNDAVAVITRKFQAIRYRSTPSSAVVSAMQPDFRVTYVFVADRFCSTRSGVTIILINITVPEQTMCGVTLFSIPLSAFTDDEGRDSRDFYIQLRPTSGELPGYVAFESTSQTLSIIPVAYQMSSATTSYDIIATHPMSGESAKSQVAVAHVDFDKAKAGICSITLRWRLTLSPFLSDFRILQTLLVQLASALNNTESYISILDYSRQPGAYPFSFNVTFTSCMLVATYQNGPRNNYNTELDTFLSKMFTKPSSTGSYSIPKNGLFSGFSKEFQLLSSEINDTCSDPRPNPPRLNKHLDPIQVPNCGEFKYEIPNDLFMDDEDGNTRALALTFYMSDNSALPADTWVIFDQTQQTLFGLPGPTSIDSQPSGGYQYLIKATDSDGGSVTTTLTLALTGDVYLKPARRAIFIGTTTIDSQYAVEVSLALTRKISAFIGNPTNELYIDSGTPVFGRSIAASVANCDACGVRATLQLLEAVNDIALLTALLPEFPATVAQELVNDDADCGKDTVLPLSNRLVIRPEPCKRYYYDLIKSLGRTLRNPKFLVKFLSEDGSPLPQNSWLFYNASAFGVVGYPTEDLFVKPGYTVESYLLLVLDAASSKTVFRVMLTFNITGNASTGATFSLRGQSELNVAVPDAQYYEALWQVINTTTGRGDVQYISMQRNGASTPFTFDVIFKFCNLSANCSDSENRQLSSKLVGKTGDASNVVINQLLPAQIKIQQVSDTCADESPVLKEPEVNITVSVCGKFVYKLPDDFVSDAEDGNVDALSISLLTSNGAALPQNSWIRYNAATREIYALPTEAIVNTPIDNGRIYTLRVSDSVKQSVDAVLKVFVEPDIVMFYRLALTFESSLISAEPHLDVQVEVLSKLSSYVGDKSTDNYRVLSFAHENTNNFYYMQIGNCTIKRTVCQEDYQRLENSNDLVITPSGGVRPEFQQAMQPRINVRSVSAEKLYQKDNAPFVLTAVDDLQLNRCDQINKELSDAIFYDNEDGDTSRLNIKMVDQQGKPFTDSFWINYYNWTIYAVPTASSPTGPGRYVAQLVATDSCGQSATTPVGVQIPSELSQQDYYKVTTIVCRMNDTQSDATRLVNTLNEIEAYLKPDVGSIKLLSYTSKDECLHLVWTDCTEFTDRCNQPLSSNIKAKLFSPGNTVNPEFEQVLSRSGSSVQGVSDKADPRCISNRPPGPVPNTNSTLEINATFCQNTSFRVPANTFLDAIDGDARNLKLTMLTENQEEIPMTSWIQFDRSSQVLYGYPRVPSDATDVLQREYKYSLVAEDSDTNTASIPLLVRLVGDRPVADLQFALKANAQALQNTPDIDQEILIISRIGEYFNNYNINNHGLTRSSRFPFVITFTWSFCSQDPAKCDCRTRSETLRKLDPITEFSNRMLPEIMVDAVRGTTTGACANTARPQLVNDLDLVPVKEGKDFARPIPANTFYDEEDGWTQNMTLTIEGESGQSVESEEWITLSRDTDNTRICGLLTVTERRARTTTTSPRFMLRATDACDLSVVDRFTTDIEDEEEVIRRRVRMGLDNEYGDVRKNCSLNKQIVDNTAVVFRVPRRNVVVESIDRGNLTENGTEVVVGILPYHNCSNASSEYLQQAMYDTGGNLKPEFIQGMGPDLAVTSARMESDPMCALPIIPPIITPAPPEPDADFPWWVFILLLVLALLFLLLWCCWMCIPRCCPSLCGSVCPGCSSCCLGKYSSSANQVDEVAAVVDGEGSLADSETNLIKGGKTELSDTDSYTAEKTILDVPPPRFVGFPSGKEGWSIEKGGRNSYGDGEATDEIIAKPAVGYPGPPSDVVLPAANMRRRGSSANFSDDLDDDVFMSNGTERESYRRGSTGSMGGQGMFGANGFGSQFGRKDRGRWSRNNRESRFDSYMEDRAAAYSSLPTPPIESSSKVVAYSYRDPRSMAYEGWSNKGRSSHRSRSLERNDLQSYSRSRRSTSSIGATDRTLRLELNESPKRRTSSRSRQRGNSVKIRLQSPIKIQSPGRQASSRSYRENISSRYGNRDVSESYERRNYNRPRSVSLESIYVEDAGYRNPITVRSEEMSSRRGVSLDRLSSRRKYGHVDRKGISSYRATQGYDVSSSDDAYYERSEGRWNNGGEYTDEYDFDDGERYLEPGRQLSLRISKGSLERLLNSGTVDIMPVTSSARGSTRMSSGVVTGWASDSETGTDDGVVAARRGNRQGRTMETRRYYTSGTGSRSNGKSSGEYRRSQSNNRDSGSYNGNQATKTTSRRGYYREGSY